VLAPLRKRPRGIARKDHFVCNASVELPPGQRTEEQYLDDNSLE
jgi:hypothetical protein